MLSADKLKELCQEQQISVDELAGHLARGGFDRQKATTAVQNWQKGLFKPEPRAEDIRRLATALSADVNDLADWRSSYRYAPISARKARLVTQLITGRSVQDALDILKFTRKRAATMIDKVLKSAVADADEQQADRNQHDSHFPQMLHDVLLCKRSFKLSGRRRLPYMPVLKVTLFPRKTT